MASCSRSQKSIVIDESSGLIFASEDEMLSHFANEIEILEKEYSEHKPKTDLSEEEAVKLESQLTPTLEEPDEIWCDESTVLGKKLHIYIREFSVSEKEPLFHVAIAYLSDEIPSFVYLHFPTKSRDFVERYQRGQIIFDSLLENAVKGALDGDALLEGDELAVGLYEAMLKLRSTDDLQEDEFRAYSDCRELSIEDSEEIWRTNDSYGNVLVHFIKEFPERKIFYIVATVEDSPSGTHALLFSFPTRDENLVERYRQGQNLHGNEVVQEASH